MSRARIYSTAVQRRCRPTATLLVAHACVKSASPFWREARVRVRRSSGRPEASTSVITWRKLGENLRCRNGSRKRLTWAKLHLNLTICKDGSSTIRARGPSSFRPNSCQLLSTRPHTKSSDVTGRTKLGWEATEGAGGTRSGVITGPAEAGPCLEHVGARERSSASHVPARAPRPTGAFAVSLPWRQWRKPSCSGVCLTP